MHYANGRAAKVGDLVRGRGYNIKHEIIGVLLTANPAATACNCTVATVTVTPYSGQWVCLPLDPEKRKEAVNAGWTLSSRVEATYEYGQLDAFVAIDPNTGEVLPPEDEGFLRTSGQDR